MWLIVDIKQLTHNKERIIVELRGDIRIINITITISKDFLVESIICIIHNNVYFFCFNYCIFSYVNSSLEKLTNNANNSRSVCEYVINLLHICTL